MSRYLFEAIHRAGRPVMGVAEASSEEILRKELTIGDFQTRSIAPLPDAPPANRFLGPSRPPAYYCMAWEDRKGEPDWMHFMALYEDERDLAGTRWLEDDKVDYCAFLPFPIPSKDPPQEPPECIQVDRERALVHFRSPGKPPASRQAAKWNVFVWIFLLVWIVGFTLGLYQTTRWWGILWLPYLIAFGFLLRYVYASIHSETVVDLNRCVVRRGLKFPVPFLSREWSLGKVDRLTVRVAYSEAVSMVVKGPTGTRRIDSHLRTDYAIGLGDGKGVIPLLRFQHRFDFDRYKGTYYPDHRKRLMNHPAEVGQALRAIGDLLRVDTIQIQSGRTELFTTLNPDTALPDSFREELAGREVSPENSRTPVAAIVSLLAFGLVWNAVVLSIYFTMLHQLISGAMSAFLILLFLTPFLGAGIALPLAPLFRQALGKLDVLPAGIKPDPRDRFSVSGSSVAFSGGAFHAAMGAWLMAAFLTPIVLGCWEMRRWEPVPCEILSSRLAESQRGSRMLYDIEVRYRFRIREREYTGDRLMSNWEPSAFRRMVENQMDKYPSGAKTTCFVDPDNPGRAVLTRDVFGTRRAKAGFGAIFLFIGAIVLGVGGRRWIKSNRPGSNALERPERILTWLLLFLGWVGIAASLLVTDLLCGATAADGPEMAPGSAASAGLDPKIPLFFGAVAILLLGRLLYHIFVKWDRTIVVSGSDFHAMRKRAKWMKRGRDPK